MANGQGWFGMPGFGVPYGQGSQQKAPPLSGGGYTKPKPNLDSWVGVPDWRRDMYRQIGGAFGWGGEMDPMMQLMARDPRMQRRFGQNAAEFFSHPGAYQALQGTYGLMERAEEPLDFYGEDWRSGLRRQVMGGAQAQIAGAQEGLGRASAARGYQGAADPLARAQLGGGGAKAIADALTALGLETEGKRFQVDEAQYGRQAQALGMLQSLLGMQPAFPYQPSTKVSSTEKFLAGAKIGVEGLKGLAGMFGLGG